MEKLLFSLITCSVTMTIVSFIIIAITKGRKSSYAVKGRYFSWIIVLFGFLTPLIPKSRAGIILIDTPSPSTALPAAETGSSLIIYSYLFIIWIFGAIAFLTISFFRQVKFIHAIRRTEKSPDLSTLEIAQLTAQRMNIKAKLKVKISPLISTPMMTGFFTPSILLPDKRFSGEELELIFAHELTHFRHRDIWQNALFILCQAVHWFNPFMSIIRKSIDNTCELYCDSEIMKEQKKESRKRYCNLILNTASESSKIPAPVISTQLNCSKESLKNRMSLILSDNKKSRFGLIFICAFVLTVLASTLFAFGSQEADNMQNATSVYQEVYETTTFEQTEDVFTTTVTYSNNNNLLAY